MRPRVFPAENADLNTHLGLEGEASMRPRVFPAENSGNSQAPAPAARRTSFNEAAGIPRGKRHRPAFLYCRPVVLASMRPRVFPAENSHVEPTVIRPVNGALQ